MEVQCIKRYFNFVLTKGAGAGASGNNLEKELQKPCSKLKKYEC